ncbi:serine protease Do [Rhizobium sp. BK650]|uniref:Do family serine endopeptidase n=1 Tax=Rhizobium sp. BK650 TaxID=2586990 RepID=UPI0016137A69|nr:Do family serine endopeptidase [Rhizobium sp. BK650]MBB3660564.1 serine protease Do [Rhizobium sp. BK650]
MDIRHAGSAAFRAAYRAIKTAFARILAVCFAAFLAVASCAEAQATDLPDLAGRVIDAVVNISTIRRADGDPNSDAQSQPAGEPETGDPPRPRGSLGSGFVIDASGIIVTNEHVIRGAVEIDVILNNGTRLRAELLGEDAYIDVAVLRVQPSTPLPVVKFADSDQIRVGEAVMAIGNPSGLGGTVTAGIVSAKNRDIRTSPFDNFIQTDAAINRGNSGGPLFNMAGDVIGINTLGLTPSGGSIGLNFAVPANTAQPIIAQLREFGETRRGWLGVYLQEMTKEIAEALRIDPARGVLISGVDPRGPAAPAGIRAGDVIVNLNNLEVRDPRQLQRIVAEIPVGTAVPVTVVREGRSTELTVTLTRREAPVPGTTIVSALGMQVSGITPELRNELRLRVDARGVVVAAVNPDSQAGRLGIRPGTVITEVQNEAVDSPGDLVRRVEALKAEGRSSLVILVLAANGQTRIVALNLS